MRSLVLFFSLAWGSAASAASQNWEVCLDRANFSFNVDAFAGSTSASKEGCHVSFSRSGGKGEKFEIDLCAALIHIDHYPSIDAAKAERVIAGSASCPAPLFGADFEENKQSFHEFRETRKAVFELWNQVKGVYGEGADKVNLADPKSFSPEVSAGKIACGDYLLREYLEKCMAFEEAKAPKKP